MSKLSHSKAIARKRRNNHNRVVGTDKTKLQGNVVDFKSLCNSLKGNYIDVPEFRSGKTVRIDVVIDRGGRIISAKSGSVSIDMLRGKQWVSLAGLNQDVVAWAEREVNR